MRRVLVAFLLIGACKRAPVPASPIAPVAPAPAAETKHVWPAGSVVAETIALEQALFFVPKAKVDPEVAARGACSKQSAALAAPIKWTLKRASLSDYAPPDAEFLEHFGHGISAAEIAALPKGERPAVLEVAGPGANASAILRATSAFISCLAEKTGGVMWDEQTREIFAHGALTERVSHLGASGAVEIEDQINLHAYDDGGVIRVVTLGMEKLGLPNLVIEKLAPTEGIRGAALVMLSAGALQRLHAIATAGSLPLVIPSEHGAPDNRVVSIAIGEPQEGDSPGPLMRLILDGKGASEGERQVAALDRILGTQDDEAVPIDHDVEIEAAIQRAKKELAALGPRYQKGLAADEALRIKAPFLATPEGTEWMWVRVTSWKGDVLHGVLENDPEHVPSLKRGAPVDVSLEKVGDYELHEHGGAISGLVLEKVLEQRNARYHLLKEQKAAKAPAKQ